MATITAKQVNELRTRTGLGMMECKKALVENDGDVDKAVDFFRKKGVKTSVAEREAGEGRVAVGVSADGTRGAIVEINCNTDFTARNDVVEQVAAAAVQKLLENPSADLSGDDGMKEKLVAVSQQTGENVRFGRTVTMKADAGEKVGMYAYTVTNKVAALVKLSGSPSDELLKDVGLHLIAQKPVALAVKRDGLPADLVAKERAIAVEQAKETGKPQEIAEKIAEGKLNSFYKERALAEQDFINPEKFKGTVGEMAKKAGAEVVAFERVEVGQATPA